MFYLRFEGEFKNNDLGSSSLCIPSIWYIHALNLTLFELLQVQQLLFILTNVSSQEERVNSVNNEFNYDYLRSNILIQNSDYLLS